MNEKDKKKIKDFLEEKNEGKSPKPYKGRGMHTGEAFTFKPGEKKRYCKALESRSSAFFYFLLFNASK